MSTLLFSTGFRNYDFYPPHPDSGMLGLLLGRCTKHYTAIVVEWAEIHQARALVVAPDQYAQIRQANSALTIETMSASLRNVNSELDLPLQTGSRYGYMKRGGETRALPGTSSESEAPCDCQHPRPQPARPLVKNGEGNLVAGSPYHVSVTGSGPSMSLDILQVASYNKRHSRAARDHALSPVGIADARAITLANDAFKLLIAYINGRLNLYPPVLQLLQAQPFEEAQTKWVCSNLTTLAKCNYRTDKVQEMVDAFSEHFGIVRLHATTFYDRMTEVINCKTELGGHGRATSAPALLYGSAALLLADICNNPPVTSEPDDQATLWDIQYSEIMCFLAMAHADSSNNIVRARRIVPTVRTDVRRLLPESKRLDRWKAFTSAGDKTRSKFADRMAGGARPTGQVLDEDLANLDCVMRPIDSAVHLSYLKDPTWTVFALETVTASAGENDKVHEGKGKGKAGHFDASFLALHSSEYVMPKTSITLRGKPLDNTLGGPPLLPGADPEAEMDPAANLPCTSFSRLVITRAAYRATDEEVELCFCFATPAQAFVAWCTYPQWQHIILLSEPRVVINAQCGRDHPSSPDRNHE
ncbi:uncharacterized protein UTRI_02582 [Ustilago trichophora]|uniref:Uncharacterized protein n=1 Tax=Ustilago trichophora TaxID=86804 RepID=A0A5C3EPM3_9BASI|nr:uncharacterized protein UTRI_02582 [Ustilago trichophora]